LAVHFCAGVAGYSLAQYTTDARLLAESVIRYYEKFQPDAVWLSADTWVSAQAMGAKVGPTGPGQPFGGLGEPLIRSAADIDRIPAPDVAAQGRYPLMLDALSRVVRELGREVFVVACFDQYPFSLASALLGLNELMLKLVDDPPFVRALIERCEEYSLAYAITLARAGADMLSGGDSPAGLIGPDLYRVFALPCEQRVVSRLKAVTDKPVSLHICGRATPILPLMKSSGADVLELDHAVELKEACDILGPGIGIWGNLDPVSILSQGDPESIVAAARRAIAQARACGHSRFVLSSGCTLDPGTPHPNLAAFLAAVR
jgi:MtaA/CmuA family methyltransferase